MACEVLPQAHSVSHTFCTAVSHIGPNMPWCTHTHPCARFIANYILGGGVQHQHNEWAAQSPARVSPKCDSCGVALSQCSVLRQPHRPNRWRLQLWHSTSLHIRVVQQCNITASHTVMAQLNSPQRRSCLFGVESRHHVTVTVTAL